MNVMYFFINATQSALFPFAPKQMLKSIKHDLTVQSLQIDSCKSFFKNTYSLLSLSWNQISLLVRRAVQLIQMSYSDVLRLH